MVVSKGLEFVLGVAKVLKIKIRKPPKGRLKVDTLAKQVMSPTILQQVRQGDLSKLLDHDGTYLIPKSALQSLARSSPLQIEGVDMRDPQPDPPASAREAGREGQLHYSSQPVSSSPDKGAASGIATTTTTTITDVGFLPKDMTVRLRDIMDPPDLAMKPPPSFVNTVSGLPSKNDTLSAEERALFEAVQQLADVRVVQRLVDRADGLMNTRHPSHGGTVLHVAAGLVVSSEEECRLTELLTALIDLGAEVNARAHNGATPLHWAAGNGSAKAVRALLLRGANPHLSTYTWGKQVFGKGSGQTPTHWAAESGHTHCVKILAEWAPLTACLRDEKGRDPLSLAMKELKAGAADVLTNVEQTDYVSLEIKTELRTTRVLPPATE